MVALRASGGPGKAGGFKFTWRGAAVAASIRALAAQAMDDEAAEILADLQASIHKVTGEMAAMAFADVEIRGGKRTIVAGSDSEHAVYEELGTRFRPGHPIIRGVMDRHAPHLTQRLAALAAGGRLAA